MSLISNRELVHKRHKSPKGYIADKSVDEQGKKLVTSREGLSQTTIVSGTPGTYEGIVVQTYFLECL